MREMTRTNIVMKLLVVGDVDDEDDDGEEEETEEGEEADNNHLRGWW